MRIARTCILIAYVKASSSAASIMAIRWLPTPRDVAAFMYAFMYFALCTAAAASANLHLPPPVQCTATGCTVEYYQRTWGDRLPCKSAMALYPTTEEELIQAVAYAARTKSKVKVVTRGSHSTTKLVCPGGDHGLIISTRDYNSQILVNLSAKTVTADAGVMLRDLLDRIAQDGLALRHSPVWEGVSVAGMISTGAHGSGMWGKGSALHDYVVGLRLITTATEEDGYVKVVDLANGDDDLDAARLSLGVLGAISKVTFELEPMFKRSVKLEVRGDERLEDEVLEFAKEHEFGDIIWYPSFGRAAFKLEDRVAVETEGEGANKMVFLQKMDVERIKGFRALADESEEKGSTNDFCAGIESQLEQRYSSGDGYLNDGSTFTGYPVVGYNHRMQTAGGCQEEEEKVCMITNPTITPTSINFHPHHHQQLEEEEEERETAPADQATFGIATNSSSSHINGKELSTCMWNPLVKGIFFFDTSISVPITRVREAIMDIKKLRDINRMGMCGLGNLQGIWIRYLGASKAYLGRPIDSVTIEMLYFRAREPNKPRLNEDIMEEIEQILLNKFGGRPHWGKNRELAFEGMLARTLSLQKFRESRQRLDPLGLFSSEWSDAVLGIAPLSSANLSYAGAFVQTFKKHCALDGLCVCKEDSHCYPSMGYYCRPGHVFQGARVCRYEEQERAP